MSKVGSGKIIPDPVKTSPRGFGSHRIRIHNTALHIVLMHKLHILCTRLKINLLIIVFFPSHNTAFKTNRSNIYLDATEYSKTEK